MPLRSLPEHQLPEAACDWRLSIRDYGTLPRSGFGIGIERFITWITGIHHLRETIPFPRMIHRLKL
ncbi:MAG: amino acid--tRNA ligase-related protein [Acidobacteriota bacterium]